MFDKLLNVYIGMINSINKYIIFIIKKIVVYFWDCISYIVYMNICNYIYIKWD